MSSNSEDKLDAAHLTLTEAAKMNLDIDGLNNFLSNSENKLIGVRFTLETAAKMNLDPTDLMSNSENKIICTYAALKKAAEIGLDPTDFMKLVLESTKTIETAKTYLVLCKEVRTDPVAFMTMTKEIITSKEKQGGTNMVAGYRWYPTSNSNDSMEKTITDALAVMKVRRN